MLGHKYYQNEIVLFIGWKGKIYTLLTNLVFKYSWNMGLSLYIQWV